MKDKLHHKKKKMQALRAACEREDVEEVKRLLQAEDYMRFPEALYAISPLSIACQANAVEAVRLLLRHATEEEVNRCPPYGASPLYYACSRGHVEVVRLLLEDGRANVNWAHRVLKTPLHVAWNHRLYSIIGLLLEDPRTLVDTELVDMVIRDDNRFVLQSLVDSGKVDWSSLSSKHIIHAMNMDLHRTTSIVDYFITHRAADINLIVKSGKRRCTALGHATYHGDYPTVQKLLGCPGIDLYKAETPDTLPFSVACEQCDMEIVRLFLSRGVDVNRRTQSGCTALHFACCNARAEASVQALLEIEEIDVNAQRDNGMTALHYACKVRSPAIIRMLLGRDDLRPNTLDVYGNTALHEACMEHGERVVETIQALLSDDRVDADIPNSCKITPLMKAISAPPTSYTHQVVTLLLTKGKANVFRHHPSGRRIHEVAKDDKIKKMVWQRMMMFILATSRSFSTISGPVSKLPPELIKRVAFMTNGSS